MKQKWGVGSLFAVQTDDSLSVVGQIVGQEPEVLNSASVAFFDKRYQRIEEIPSHSAPDPAEVFAILFVTRDLLDSGVWRVVGESKVVVPQVMLPYEHLRESKFTGAKVYGSGIVNAFLNAFYGLALWDDWHDPNYLDRLLLTPDKKPLQRLVRKHY